MKIEAAAVVVPASYPQVVPEDESVDLLAPPDIDKYVRGLILVHMYIYIDQLLCILAVYMCRLNDEYITVHEASVVGRHLWLRASEQIEASQKKNDVSLVSVCYLNADVYNAEGIC